MRQSDRDEFGFHQFAAGRMAAVSVSACGKIAAMRLLVLCLTLACGPALAGELFQPYTPPSLTAEQMNQRDWWIKQPGFKSITNVKVDSVALKSNVVTVTIKGKTHRIKGERTWHKAVVGIGQRQIGGFNWRGQSADGSGSYLYSDEGHFIGDFTLGEKHYTVAGSDGMCMAGKSLCFLVETPQPEPGGSSLALFRPIPTVLSAEQASAQEDYYKATGFKTIETIQIDREVLNLHSSIIALTVKGKRYRLVAYGYGAYDRPTTDPGRKLRTATWLNESTDDHGHIDVSADERIVGDFTLGGWKYRVMSGDGVDFLLQSEEPAPAASELFQAIVPAPALSASQAKAKDYWAKRPEVISITPVRVDPAALKSNVIVMTIKGQPRHLVGNWRTHPISPGTGTQTTSWEGFSSQGSGNLYFSDNGSVSGEFTITRDPGQGHYKLMGGRDGALLIEHKEFPFYCGTSSGILSKILSGTPTNAAGPPPLWMEEVIWWMARLGLFPKERAFGK